MKSIKDLFHKGLVKPSSQLDEKTILYLFQKIIKKKYGERGSMMIQPVRCHDAILSIRTKSPLWSNELWLVQKELIQSLNEELGENSVTAIKLIH